MVDISCTQQLSGRRAVAKLAFLRAFCVQREGTLALASKQDGLQDSRMKLLALTGFAGGSQTRALFGQPSQHLVGAWDKLTHQTTSSALSRWVQGISQVVGGKESSKEKRAENRRGVLQSTARMEGAFDLAVLFASAVHGKASNAGAVAFRHQGAPAVVCLAWERRWSS